MPEYGLLPEMEEHMNTLKDVSVGSTVTVKKLEGDGAAKRRIMDMGITKDNRFKNRSFQTEKQRL